ncbi:hypothetical protein AMQ84_29850 [Paenibacillus riograndensis]|uniref:Uncharacterized protein n=1 Tax=Paenibacillus riograndensis TaxID=483937 RepID=A0A132TGX6_9BACL|nr:P-loop NTPase fold protein [Paenibacillus riograndensis]KWX70276.1 hypothetical protein AMQ84_29850 [Paenibacillus riograndensis]
MQQEEVTLGARDLKDQISKTMPTYSIMLSQVKDIRETVKRLESSNKDQDGGKRVYINTIGIFGPRGSGKSSALYTMRGKMDSKSSILLPLIEPDNFGENTKIVGSIVGFLKEAGEKLLEVLKKGDLKCDERKHLIDSLADYYNAGIYKPNNKLKQLIDDTIEYHLYTENQYRNILTQHYEDLAVYVKNSSRVLIPDIAFKKKFNELINEIIRVKQILDNPKEPILIFIFIDDIDLQTSKTRELMEALLQYMDHPHVVTVLSGDYDILLESLTLKLLADEPLQKIGLTAYNSLKVLEQPEKALDDDTRIPLTIMRRKSELAHEYMKKIIPSARRHQLVNWNTDTIPYFSFGQYNLLDRMAQLMGERSIFNYVNPNSKNELYLPLKKSYIVFDERPRGIVHAYYNLVQLLSDIENSKAVQFGLVKAFIDTLILSNTKLLMHQQWLFEQFLQWGSDEKSTNINYSAWEKYKDGDKENESLDLQIFIIAEIVKKLLHNVRYEGFTTFKDKLFKNFIGGSKAGKDNVYIYRHRLYHLMRGLVLHIDVPAAMLMIEYLSRSAYDPYYYEYEYASNNNRKEKDRFVVECMAELLEQYPSVFRLLYYKAQNEKNDDVNKALNILHDLCNIPPEYEITERVFEEVLRSFNFQKTQDGISDDEIKRTLFINSLTLIREMQRKETPGEDRGDLNSIVTVIAKDQNNTLAKALVSTTKRLSENPGIKLPVSVTQTINNRMDVFGKYIFSKLKETNIAVKIEMTVSTSKIYKEFEDGYSGEGDTIYNECKYIVFKYLYRDSNRIYINFENYKIVLQSLLKLATNNRAWYGRSEARNLYNSLRYSSTIAERNPNTTKENRNSFFTGNDSFILNLYYKYYAGTQTFSDDQVYENAKAGIRAKLDEAFNTIKGQTEIELSEFEMSLEEAEEHTETSGAVE